MADQTKEGEEDVWKLFEEFNNKYFSNKLNHVKLSWSTRMTLCAGKTIFKGRGKNKICAIRLSKPLLSQRPHDDTVNTLLHEMIHAYLHVTKGNKVRDSHGPEFHKYMNRINAAHGSKITVYHTFRKEVDKFRVHIYRCDGPCVSRRPFFGILRRAVSRPPGPEDKWYERHEEECGGWFHKIAGPGVDEGNAEGTERAGNAEGTERAGEDKLRGVRYGGACGGYNWKDGRSEKFGEDFEGYDWRAGMMEGGTGGYERAGGTTSTARGGRKTTGRGRSSSARNSQASQSNLSNYESLLYDSSRGKSRISRVASGGSHNNKRPAHQITLPGIDDGETSVVERIKTKYANTKHTILLSKEQANQAELNHMQARFGQSGNDAGFDRQGPSNLQGPRKRMGFGVMSDVCALVDGKMNYRYIPKNLENLNIHKYLKRYKEAVEGTTSRGTSRSGSRQVSSSSTEGSTNRGASPSGSRQVSSSNPAKISKTDQILINSLNRNTDPIPQNSLNRSGSFVDNGTTVGAHKPGRKCVPLFAPEIDKYMKRYKEAVEGSTRRGTSRTGSGQVSSSITEGSTHMGTSRSGSRQVGSSSTGNISKTYQIPQKSSNRSMGFVYNGTTEGAHNPGRKCVPLIAPVIDKYMKKLREAQGKSTLRNSGTSGRSDIQNRHQEQEVRVDSRNQIPQSAGGNRRRSDESQKLTKCPVCSVSIPLANYEQHLSECFGNDLDLDFGDDFDLESSGDCGKSGGESQTGGARETEQEDETKDWSLGKRKRGEGGRNERETERGQGKKDDDRTEWEDWQKTDCPNCGAKILKAERDFHLQFCLSSDDDDSNDLFGKIPETSRPPKSLQSNPGTLRDDPSASSALGKSARISHKTNPSNSRGTQEMSPIKVSPIKNPANLRGTPKMLPNKVSHGALNPSNSRGTQEISPIKVSHDSLRPPNSTHSSPFKHSWGALSPKASPSKYSTTSQDSSCWDSSDEEEEEGGKSDYIDCPSCMEKVMEINIQSHLDECLSFLCDDF